jgi:tripartite-type tricarboxylate transporter receptor subunit TctC
MSMFCRTLVAISLAAACASAALAQGFPSKPIRIVVGFPPGGVNDTLARVVATKMTELMGSSVIIENRPGAGGNVASAFVAKAAPDGYTVLSGSTSAVAVAANMYRSLPFDPLKDFQPVTRIADVPAVLIAGPAESAGTLDELIAAAKAQPGKMNYGSGGNGTIQHITGELFKLRAGVDVVHVPFKGGAPALVELVAGRLSYIFEPLPTALPNIQSRKVKPIAVTRKTRLAALPQVPTMAETGLPDFEMTIWIGFLAPSGVPRDIINRLNMEMVRAIRSPDVLERIAAQGVEPLADSVEEFRTVMAAENARMADFVKRTGIRLD